MTRAHPTTPASPMFRATVRSGDCSIGADVHAASAKANTADLAACLCMAANVQSSATLPVILA